MEAGGIGSETPYLPTWRYRGTAAVRDNVALQYGDSLVLREAGRVVAETERPEGLSKELLERVFRVRTRRIGDEATGESVWRFAL